MAGLILLLPHLALAPHVSGSDLVLGMEGGDRDHPAAAARRMVALVVSQGR